MARTRRPRRELPEDLDAAHAEVEAHVARRWAELRADISAAIAESGLTSDQVAALAGVSASMLRNMLNGRNYPQIDKLVRVGLIVGRQIIVSPGKEGSD